MAECKKKGREEGGKKTYQDSLFSSTVCLFVCFPPKAVNAFRHCPNPPEQSLGKPDEGPLLTVGICWTMEEPVLVPNRALLPS
jgi:hypothetical protein